MTEKEGLGLRGVAFMTVLAVLTGFGGSGERLALLLLVLQNTVPRKDCDGFGGCDQGLAWRIFWALIPMHKYEKKEPAIK